ncbi:MAG: hypothetical protein FWH11_10995 [Micrococcales bacterium]|nr:hypothetical protein [Micrococcales bacterium]
MSTPTPDTPTPAAGTPSDGAAVPDETAAPGSEPVAQDLPGETEAQGSASDPGPDPDEDGATAPVPRAARFRPAGLVLTVVGVLLALPLVASGAWTTIMYSVGTWHHTAHTETVAPVISLVTDGPVKITVDPGATQVSVQADAWYAWDWQAPTYQATSTGDRLEIRHECGSFPVSPSCEAGLTVVLPPDTQLQVRSGNGSVVASDLTGPVDVSSSDGRIELSRIGGDVVAHSGNGRVEVTDVAGSATVSSSDGKVVVSGVGGDVITARSGNGRVEVSEVAGSATAVSRDGAVLVNQVGGDVDARSGNGRVEVVSVAGSATAVSRDGAVLVEDALGNVTARSGNGSVTVYGAGVPVALDISSGNGNQRIEAATDPAAPISVTIRSSDGNVSYLAPRGPSRLSPPPGYQEDASLAGP